MTHRFSIDFRQRRRDPRAKFEPDVRLNECLQGLWFDRMGDNCAGIDLTPPQKYTVYRKMPMMVTRSARMLTIDGGYIHVRSIPTVTNRRSNWTSRSYPPSLKRSTSSTAARRPLTTSRVLLHVNSQARTVPHSNSLCTAAPIATSATSSRRKTLSLLVRLFPASRYFVSCRLIGLL